jgi:serine/threonine-protein kinase
MGVVVAAHHLALDARVAIKLMRPELRARNDLVRRFLREARAAARLHSPHVTRVFDVATLDDGCPYIVMEYLEGSDLAAWLQQHGPVPASAAAELVLQALDAVAEAHAAGIVHRDLKPANLFVTRARNDEPLLKVLDLGICKLVEAGSTTISSAAVVGTPPYMAPEQLAARPRADARSDIWALGVILHELVTGRRPFSGSTVEELRIATRTRCPPITCADVPSELAAVVARCLAIDPAERFECAADVAAALAPLTQGRAAPGVLPIKRGARRSRWLRRWRTLLAAALAASGAALIALALAPVRPSAGSPAGHERLPQPTAAPSPEPLRPSVLAPQLEVAHRSERAPPTEAAPLAPPVLPARTAHRQRAPSGRAPDPSRADAKPRRSPARNEPAGLPASKRSAAAPVDAPVSPPDVALDPLASPD